MEEHNNAYNLPIAAFTFGKNGQALPTFSQEDYKLVKNSDNFQNNNNTISNNNLQDSSLDNGQSNPEISKSKNNIKINNMNTFVFTSKDISNDSYIKVILYSIYNIKLLYNHLLNEFQQTQYPNNNIDYRILFNIKEIYSEIEKKNNIDITLLKQNLYNLFKNKKKFLKNCPDDPSELLFVILNGLHSSQLKIGLNETSDDLCNEKCLSHKYFWLDLTRVDECACNAHSNKKFSNHNYITDIPIDQILSQTSTNENFFDFNQKLFFYFKKLISKINILCPKNGNMCAINKVTHKFILNNTPSYLFFKLTNNDINPFINFNYPSFNILKIFILIPPIFNITNLFYSNINAYQIQNSNEQYFELFGFIFLKISKIYTCAFKQDNVYYYHDEDISISFQSYYELVFYAIKNGLMPIMLFFQDCNLIPNQNKNSINFSPNSELSKEQIAKLEKFVKTSESFYVNLKNKIRTSENIIPNIQIIPICDKNKYNTNQILKDNINNIYNNISDNSSRLSSSVASSNSQKGSNKIKEYICFKCNRININEEKICKFCGFNNNKINKNQNNKILNENNINNNVNINRKYSYKNSNNNNNNSKININNINNINNIININNKTNNENQLDDDNFNQIIDPNVLKYFDMPRPYIPSTMLNKRSSDNKELEPKKINNNNIIQNNNQINNNNNVNNISINNRIIENLNNNQIINNEIKNNFLQNKKININYKDKNNNNANSKNKDFRNKKTNLNKKAKNSNKNNNTQKINYQIPTNNNNISNNNSKNQLTKNFYSNVEDYHNDLNQMKKNNTDNLLNNLNFKYNKKEKYEMFHNNNYALDFQEKLWTCDNCYNKNSINNHYCKLCRKYRKPGLQKLNTPSGLEFNYGRGGGFNVNVNVNSNIMLNSKNF